MGEFEEVVKTVGRVKEVRYVFFSCVLLYHQFVGPESDVGYYFVFVWRVFRSNVPVFGGDVCHIFLVTVLFPWMPRWFGGIVCR